MKKVSLYILAILFVSVISVAVTHAKIQPEVKEELSSFTSVDAKVDMSDIKLVKCDKYQIEINHCVPQEKIHYNVENNRLIITTELNNNAISQPNLNCHNKITVYAPQIDIIKLSSNAGDVMLDSQKTNELSININSGDIRIENSSIKNSNISTNCGDISILNTKIKDVNASAKTGDANIDLLEQCNLKLIVKGGTIKVDDEEYEKEYINNVSSDNNVNVQVSCGDINVKHKKTSNYI